MKPLFIYDGDCHFCKRWVARWHAHTGDRVDYLPYQEPGVLSRLGIPVASARHSSQLVMPDGARHEGAEAVFRLLLLAPGTHVLARIGLLPLVRWLANRVYRFIAKHRTMASRIDSAMFSPPTEPPRYGALHPQE